ncbi:hypothetical protein F4774DRAFT_425589 [Daldinia eschscholtzii]|nr:hypothetical protein F4774DRAFT_425589 [Daldinia eschscholtzii]
MSHERREPGSCDPGFVFYSCHGGFVGCCAVDACTSGGCPDDAVQPGETPADITITTTLNNGVETQTVTVLTSMDGTSFPFISISSDSDSSSSSSSSESPTISTGTTISPPPLSSLSAPSSSTSLLETPTPISTSTSTPALPQNSNSSNATSTHHLSTAALIGICISSTIIFLTTAFIIGLLIRRRRIAKRMAAEPMPNSPYADEPERFMMDHPAWKGQGQGQGQVVRQEVSELP